MSNPPKKRAVFAGRAQSGEAALELEGFQPHRSRFQHQESADVQEGVVPCTSMGTRSQLTCLFAVIKCLAVVLTVG
jgi:hypothetical protein